MMRDKRLACLVITTVLLSLTACGLRDHPEAFPAETENHPVAVAEIYEMELPVSMDQLDCHALSDTWLYLTDRHYDNEQKVAGCRLLQNNIHKEYNPDIRIWEVGVESLALVPGQSGECFLFGKFRERDTYFLNIYDVEGTLQCHNEYAGAEFENIGEQLTNGVATADGCLYLYAYGASNSIYAFDQEGNLTAAYHSQLKSLEGLAVGKENRVYAYHITEDEPLFTELGTTTTPLSCPIRPSKVFGGYDEGLYLSTGDGFWQYDPETGETNLLWEWNGDYIQLSAVDLDQVFYGRDGLYLLFYDQVERPSKIKESLIIARITIQDSRDYPDKQVITLGTVYDSNINTHVEELIRLYNHQSRDYRVELVTYDDPASHTIDELELRLMRGDGPDLMELTGMYSDALISHGVFEELDNYYQTSDKIQENDLLDCIRKSSCVTGHNVLVIPSFRIVSIISKQDISPQDWTPWNFLELSKKEQLFQFPSGNSALTYCMGIRYGEHFIDYEKRECHFDCEEFISILEQCADLEFAEIPLSYTAPPLKEAAYMMTDMQSLSSTSDYLHAEWVHGNIYWVGYPGWDGMENALYPDEAFAMNSASPNKEGAWDFLEFLLSSELQDRIDWGFPSRKDCFESYLYSSYQPDGKYQAKDFGATTSWGYTRNPIEEDFAVIRRLVDTAVYQSWGANGNTIRNIIMEESSMYFSGDATIDETVKKIQNRVSLYLNEL